MESVLFRGAHVLGLGPADVGVRDGRIDLVGAGREEDYDRVIPAENCALLPGFVSTTATPPMTLLRSVADDLPPEAVAGEKIWPPGGQAPCRPGVARGPCWPLPR